MSLTYSDYLNIEKLLMLQEPRSDGPEHDEVLFIIIHQVYELWFKQLLHEVKYLQNALHVNQETVALHTFKRILTILKTMVAQIDILETMTPISFLSFRKRLDSASGFQSSQFRELEFALGKKSEASLKFFAEGTPARARLEARWNAPSLYDSFLRYLGRNGVALPEGVMKRDFTVSIDENVDVQSALIDVYRNKPSLIPMCERMLDLDEGLQEWRYRHVKMVERTIGTKRGTGGSSGADYLKSTILKPLFPDLWAIRSEL